MRIDRFQTDESIRKLATPIPINPHGIELSGRKAFEYISLKAMETELEIVSKELSIGNRGYKDIVVNTKGGFPFSHHLHRLNAQEMPANPTFVEYHSSSVINPIPETIGQDEKILIIDDICDTGMTLFKMLYDHPNADILVVILKSGVPNQIPVWKKVENFWAVFITENLVLGGMGSDFGNWIDPERQHSGIVYLADN